MKRKISTTLAVTLIASNMQTLSFAQDNENLQEISNKGTDIVNESIVEQDETKSEDINIKDSDTEDTKNNQSIQYTELKKQSDENSNTESEVYEGKGKLELDLNFSLPIKYTTSNQTNITVKLKKDNESLGSINLGNDNLTGNINSDINYKLEAKNSKRQNLEENATEVSFYHLTFENLPLGTYSLEIEGKGYETASIDNIDIVKSSKRVLVGTSENKVIVDDKEETYPAVFLAGDVNSDNIVSILDYEELKAQIKSNDNQDKVDLNRDGKTDITDLTYIHQNMDKSKSQAVIVDTDIIVNPENSSINIDDSKVEVIGDIKNILKSENSSVVLQTKSQDGTEVNISEQNPVSIPISLDNTTRSINQTEKIVIKAPSANAPSKGNITIPGAGENGQDLVVAFNNKNIRSTRSGEDEIVIDLGKQVAVSQITINITFG